MNVFEPYFDGSERTALFKYMGERAWLTEHKYTRYFEDMIREFVGAKYCVVTTSGTMALMLAVSSVSAREFVVPNFTMIATKNACRWVGKEVSYRDIERETFGLDYKEYNYRYTWPKTVILVSINGRFPRMGHKIIEKGYFVIEDACQSFGSFHNGKAIGTFGDIGCYSFSPHKIITTGQGGACVTDNSDLYKELRMLKDFGREEPGSENYGYGINGKFTDLQAIVGIEQMKNIEWRIKRKKEIWQAYTGEWPDFTPWCYYVLDDNRDKLAEYLKSQGVMSRPFYPVLDGGDYPVSKEISRKGLWLPSHLNLGDMEINYIKGKLKEFNV